MVLLALLIAGCGRHAVGRTDRLTEQISHRLVPVPIQSVKIQDDFWSPKRQVWRAVTIPTCLTSWEKEGAIVNYDRVRDGLSGGHQGIYFCDGGLEETIRGVADYLVSEPDPALEARVDGYIQHIAAAAAVSPDGYLDTHIQLEKKEHWNAGYLEEEWTAGCMIEAAVHYSRATGKTDFMKVASKMANHMCDVIGPPPRRNVSVGHSLAEEALVRLHALYVEQPQLKQQMPVPVDENRYLELARFFIENRGNHKDRVDWGIRGQDDKSGLLQDKMQGHAVMCGLMCAGMAAIAYATDRDDYTTASQRLWNDMANHQMMVTGSVGPNAEGEAYWGDDMLPNNSYNETCAAIAAGFFQPQHEHPDGRRPICGCPRARAV